VFGYVDSGDPLLYDILKLKLQLLTSILQRGGSVEYGSVVDAVDRYTIVWKVYNPKISYFSLHASPCWCMDEHSLFWT
jgi:hypothetical protein